MLDQALRVVRVRSLAHGVENGLRLAQWPDNAIAVAPAVLVRGRRLVQSGAGGWRVLAIKGAAKAVRRDADARRYRPHRSGWRILRARRPLGRGKIDACSARSRGWSSSIPARIEIDGEVVNDWRPHAAQRRHGVPDRRAASRGCSVYNNIAFSLKARKVPRAEIEARVQARRGNPRHRGPASPADARAATRGRPAARGDRARGRARRGCLPPRRAARRISTLDARDADARGDQAASPRISDDQALRHPRRARGDDARRARRADARRPDRAGGHRRSTLFERPLTRFVAGFFGWPKMNFLARRAARDAAAAMQIRLERRRISVKLPPNRLPKEAADGLAGHPRAEAGAHDARGARLARRRRVPARGGDRDRCSRSARAPTRRSGWAARRWWPSCRPTT